MKPVDDRLILSISKMTLRSWSCEGLIEEDYSFQGASD